MDRSSSIRQHRAAGARSGARHSRLSIDLRGHGPALEAIAQSRRMRLTTLVRTALAEWLASRAAGGDGPSIDASPAYFSRSRAAFQADLGQRFS